MIGRYTFDLDAAKLDWRFWLAVILPDCRLMRWCVFEVVQRYVELEE